MSYHIKVVWKDGEEELLKQGMGDQVAVFRSYRAAQEQAEFMRMGMDDVQSVNVVRAEEGGGDADV